MAYFPNGSSGVAFQERFCEYCANADEDGGCVIWDAHLFYNYEQFQNAGLKDVLNMLIEQDDKTGKAQCALYRKEV